MIKNLKIHIALLVCVVFLFRLLFVNIGIISSLNTKQSSAVAKSILSSVMKKRRKNNEAIVNSYAKEYSVIEICEEENENDEDNFSKINPFILIGYLYSALANKFDSLKSKIPFDFLNYKLSSKKYLAISVLRI